jgi:hypothetical protein
MELFVLPSFDHDCTLRGARFDDISVIAPECAPCLEGEDGGPFYEGHCFAGGGTVEERRWPDASLLQELPLLATQLCFAHIRMFDDQADWGASDVVSTGDIVKDTMKKEQIIKYVQFMSSLALIAYTIQGYCRFSR